MFLLKTSLMHISGDTFDKLSHLHKNKLVVPRSAREFRIFLGSLEYS